jgi:hypothetical protein
VGRRQEQARRIELENGTEMSKVHWGRCTVGLGKKRVITNDQIGEESAPAGAGCRATANLVVRAGFDFSQHLQSVVLTNTSLHFLIPLENIQRMAFLTR